MSDRTSQTQVRDLPRFLKSFARDPIGTIRRPLSMSWPAAFSLQVGAAMVSGALVGILNRNFWDFLGGLLIFPITSLVTGLVFSLFLYYFFSFFRATFLDFRRLHSITAVAMVPYFLLHTISGFLPPIDLIGFALTSMVLVVGLVEQFGLERRVVARVIAGVALAFFVAWSVVQYRSSRSEGSDKSPSPQSLDSIERDIE